MQPTRTNIATADTMRHRDSARAQDEGAAPADLAGPTAEQRHAVSQVLVGYLGARPGTRLILVFERHRESEAAWTYLEAKAQGIEVTLMPVRTGRDLGAPVPDARTAEGENGGSGLALVVLARQSLANSARLASWSFIRAAYLPGRSLIDLPGAISISPDDLRVAADGVVRALNRAAPVTLTALNGSSLTFELAADWIAVCGGTQADRRMTLPSGFAIADVGTADGTFVADGAVGINRDTNLPRRTHAHPVLVEIADGRVVGVGPEDGEYARLLRRAIERHGIDRVRAISVGLNASVPGYSDDDSQLNIVRPGARIVIGASSDRTYASASADLQFELLSGSVQIAGGDGKLPVRLTDEAAAS